MPHLTPAGLQAGCPQGRSPITPHLKNPYFYRPFILAKFQTKTHTPSSLILRPVASIIAYSAELLERWYKWQ